MANLIEPDSWPEGVYQIEEDDPVLGGATGITNQPPTQLAARSRFQRLRNITPWEAALSYPAAIAYVSHAGKTWKSVTASVNVAPGSDETRWIRWGHTADELGESFSAHEAEEDPHAQYVQSTGDTMTGPLNLLTAAQADNTTKAASTAFVKRAVERNGTGAVAAGTANAIVVTYSPVITELVDGMVIWFKSAASNTGATTLKVDALAIKPLLGAAHAPLQGGEIVLSGRCMAVWNATIDSFVLVDCTGAARQVGNASKPQHAVALAQFAATLTSTTGIARIPRADAPSTPFIVQTGKIINSGGGVTSAVFPMAFPNSCLSVLLTGYNISNGFQAYATLNDVSNSGFRWSAFSGFAGAAPTASEVGGVGGYFIAIGT